MKRGLRDMENTCRHVRDELSRERLGRRDLAALEAQMATMAEDLELGLHEAQQGAEYEPDLALADVALQAVNRSLEWARMFRKHATLRERREQLQIGLQGAAAVVGVLRRHQQLRV